VQLVFNTELVNQWNEIGLNILVVNDIRSC